MLVAIRLVKHRAAILHQRALHKRYKSMVQARIRISVPPEKLKEVLQTFRAILAPIRAEPGCISCNCYLDAEVENNVCFIEEWQGGDDLNSHLRSGHFRILAGAMKLFIKEPDIMFHIIASTAGAEAITAARGHNKNF